MGVHIFGAVSSPSIANYALRAAADHAGDNKLVLKSIPQEDCSKDLQTCDLDYDELHVERALGLQWNIENDYFTFSASLDPKPLTKREWSYVQSKGNPTDIVSRGFTCQQMLNSNIWFDGPYFLGGPEELWKNYMPQGVVELEGSKSFAVHPVDGEGNAVDKFLKYYSSWHQLGMAVAVYHRLFSILKSKKQPRLNGSITTEELDAAGKAVIRYIQKKTFSKEVTLLQKSEGLRGRGLCSSSSIYKLDPYINPKDRLLRVNGLLSKAKISAGEKHRMMLPRKSHITTLIIRYTHEKLAYSGRNHAMAKLRELYWIIRTNASVRQILQRCVICRTMRNPVLNQKMADLPLERVIPAAPFTHTGVDFFGPQEVKEGRQIRKRYGVLFTCLSTRAIHIERADSLDTSSYINALRMFVARRGNVKKIWCDNGTSFHGAEKELRKSLQEMNDDQVEAFLSKESISWTFNPPAASHMGGVWERQIRTVRKVLTPLFKEHAGRLDDESYRTLLTEVEAIVNDHPLTTVSDSPEDLKPLSPAQLLTQKSSVVMPPPGVFQKGDIYLRQRW
ncbi:uncharacterized protein [Palaemon carinicauda]|uniref:uncharacterized protein n=1 Tax=Palaemon carinicauda TaxID=392227 RepID=UPI0035B64AB7